MQRIHYPNSHTLALPRRSHRLRSRQHARSARARSAPYEKLPTAHTPAHTSPQCPSAPRCGAATQFTRIHFLTSNNLNHDCPNRLLRSTPKTYSTLYHQIRIRTSTILIRLLTRNPTRSYRRGPPSDCESHSRSFPASSDHTKKASADSPRLYRHNSAIASTVEFQIAGNCTQARRCWGGQVTPAAPCRSLSKISKKTPAARAMHKKL